MSTAIAETTNPVLMASVVKKGVELGREAFIAEHMPHRHYGSASSTIGRTFF